MDDSGNKCGVVKWATRSLALPIACILSLALWSDNSWGQRTRTDSPLGQERPQPLPQPATTSPAAPITFPATNPSSPLSNALASCETGADTSEFTLPSTRGDVKLGRCYRGRDHLVCQFNALLTEAKSLLENYRKIIDANYPELRDLDGICSIKAEALPNDLHAATEF